MASPSTRGGGAFEAERARIQHALETHALTIVYQPVVDIRRGVVVGVEALARFSAEPRRTPDVWFKEAWDAGLGLELELLAIELALEMLSELPESVYIAVNTDPRTLLSPDLAVLLGSTRECTRIVVELTEHAAVADYDKMNAALAPLRAMGVRIAIDDAGAGFASLQHVLRLRPDIIKLDRSLTLNVEDNPVRGALTAALVTFAASLNASVCAEGIETERQLVALQKIGVANGQGYFIARPAPLPLPEMPNGIWPSRPNSVISRIPSSPGAPVIASRSRLDALVASGLLDSAKEESFDRLTRLATRVLGAEIALVSFVDEQRQFFKSSAGLGEPLASLRETPLTHSLCKHAVTTGLPIIIEDARQHPLVRDDAAVHELGVGAYLGIPLVTSTNQALGCFCVIETGPRRWSEEDVAVMQDIAATVIDLIEKKFDLRLYEERADTYVSLFNQVGTASALVELDGKIRRANRAFASLLGYDPEELLGIRAATLTATSDHEAAVELHRTVLVGDAPEALLRTTLHPKHGRSFPATLRWVIVRNHVGAAQYALLTILDGDRELVDMLGLVAS